MSFYIESFEEHPLLKRIIHCYMVAIIDALLKSLRRERDFHYKMRGFNEPVHGIHVDRDVYLALFRGCDTFSDFGRLKRRPQNTEASTTFKIEEIPFLCIFGEVLREEFDFGEALSKKVGNCTLTLEYPFVTFYNNKKQEMFFWVNTAVTEDGREGPLIRYKKNINNLLKKRKEKLEKQRKERELLKRMKDEEKSLHKIVKPKKMQRILRKNVEVLDEN